MVGGRDEGVHKKLVPDVGLSQRRARLVARLRVSKTRRKEGLVLVEGVRAVREALEAGADGRFAVTSPRLQQTSGGSALATRLAATALELHVIDAPYGHDSFLLEEARQTPMIRAFLGH